MKDYLLGVDIGGTKTAVILGRRSFAPEEMILERRVFSTRTELGPDQAIEAMCRTIEAVLEERKLTAGDICGIGISCGGPLDYEKGIIMSPPNLYGWDNIHITEILEKRFGIRAYLQNDANAGCLAEWKYGAARGCQNVIFLTYGTGMGAGLILDGRLYNGANGMAGEVGHMRLEPMGPAGYGKAGSFEGFCSGAGVAQLAKIMALEKLQCGIAPAFCRDISELQGISAKTVAEAADAGDETAVEVFRTSGRYLGRALSVLVDVLNPDVIVCGSVFARNVEKLLPSAMEVLRQEALGRSLEVCRIVPAELGEEIGDFAALSVADR